MVEVEILSQVKTTKYKPASLSPIFNEVLFFEYTNLSSDDLVTAMIKIMLLDHDFIGSNNQIG